MAGTPIGRILLMPKGDYSASAVYNSLDWVRYAGAAWVCKLDNTTGVTPSTSATTEWALMSADGSVGGWSTLANKPFETIGVGLEVPSSGAEQGQLKLDPDYLIGSNISYANTTSGLTATNVQDAIDEVVSDLDEFTASATCYADSSLVKVAFDDLNTNYGYELCFDDQNQALPSPIPSQIGNPTKGSGTNSGIKLVYTLANATAGTHKFALRILK